MIRPLLAEMMLLFSVSGGNAQSYYYPSQPSVLGYQPYMGPRQTLGQRPIMMRGQTVGYQPRIGYQPQMRQQPTFDYHPHLMPQPVLAGQPTLNVWAGAVLDQGRNYYLRNSIPLPSSRRCRPHTGSDGTFQC